MSCEQGIFCCRTQILPIGNEGVPAKETAVVADLVLLPPFLRQQASWNVLLWLADRFRRTGRERLTNSVRVLVQPLAQQEQLMQYAAEIRS